MFDEVDPRIDFPAAERRVLRFWDENRIPDKALAAREGGERFVFYEGPPTSNGMPHPGHCLTRTIKDVFPRYRTMRGQYCLRKAGFDTHGLPVETEVGKRLGLASKEDIEAFGVEPFVKECVKSVFQYTGEWEQMTRRIGFWVDLDDAYATYRKSYVESVWWALKTLFDRGLLYRGHKIVWWWAQGGTALSSGEVGEGRREVDDPSVFVKFTAAEPAQLPFDAQGDVPTHFVAWTTTPWTLPSNTALCVGADFAYVLVEALGERYVLAAELVDAVFKNTGAEDELVELGRCKGSELVGLAYQPPFDYAERPTEGKAWQVATADFVTLKSGSGIVHVAPAFGEDDYKFGREQGFGFIQLVGPDGKFRPQATDVAGQWVKDADPTLIRLLKERGKLVKREQYRHEYPFCPRAPQDALIQYAREGWFVNTTQFKDEFLANNARVDWLPEHIQEGRFGEFLRTNVDWAVSRERYWGTPLPIWVCSDTGKMEAVGSYAELLAKPGVQGLDAWTDAKAAEPDLLDDLQVHKPYVDALTYDSPFAAGARMERVTEVIDCWFDAGSMPFAQWGWPHAGGETFKDQFPAQFISEAIDQTRGWFYSLLSIATMLQDELAAGAGVEAKYPLPFETCIVLGHMLGEDGAKMSKRLGNYRTPDEVFDEFGADAMRWLFLFGQPPWNSARFQTSEIRDAQRDFLIRLHNVYSFFVIYANIDRFDPATADAPPPGRRAELDRWILGELHATVRDVTAAMDAFDNFTAARRLHAFVDGLSNWYVRRSRDRFWAGGTGADKLAAMATLYECLRTLTTLLAPFVPFYAETLHQNLVRKPFPDAPESVHLLDWPACDESLIDGTLSAEMDLVREVVSVGRAARTNAKLKVRQPLSAVEVLVADHRHDEPVRRYADLIAGELNVRKVELAADAGQYVAFEVKPNPRVLGPRFGKKLPQVKKALAAMDGAELRRKLVDDGRFAFDLDGQTVELTEQDVHVNLAAREGYAAADGRRVVVVLATGIDEDLRREGVARELIHHIQGMRRELDLDFDRRIAVAVAGDSAFDPVVAQFGDLIRGETLADTLVSTATPEGALTSGLTLGEDAVAVAVSPA